MTAARRVNLWVLPAERVRFWRIRRGSKKRRGQLFYFSHVRRDA